MGNQNSANVALAHPPAKWTQSYPRDPRKHHRYGAIPENKVLPQRIPGQRLRPTENGRHLQVEGTITGRRASEFSVPPNNMSTSPYNHSSSMTALNMPPQSGVALHELRFGPPPKTYTSEPDLRGSSPQHQPPSAHSPSTIISQSPTKGRIKSKKRNKAPNPPAVQIHPNSILHDVRESPRSVNSNESNFADGFNVSSDTPKSKSKKIGLFKKKNDSKKSSYDYKKSINSDPKVNEMNSGSRYKVYPDSADSHVSATSGDFRSIVSKEGASVSVGDHRSSFINSQRNSSREELRERAKSLDCLHHEIQRTSPTGTSSISDLHTALNTSNESSKRSFSPNGCRTLDRKPSKSQIENTLRKNSTIERASRPRSATERLDESNPQHESISNEIHMEWDRAEREMIQKRKQSIELQRTIQNAAKNLKKSNSNIQPQYSSHDEVDNAKEKPHHASTNDLKSKPEGQPKTFFFGMEPEVRKDSSVERTAALAKINSQDEITMNKTTVSYTKRTLERTSKRSSSKNRDYSTDSGHQSESKILDKRKISRDIDVFAQSLGKLKQSNNNVDGYNNQHRNDGGYHSRQNSGSFRHDTDQNSDESSSITMNIKPTLPRRQFEIPRFSPNAAWRSLSSEPTSRYEESMNESRSSEDTEHVFEDKILRNTRPTAPPRGSGEKSADSGISGDAGSPGPMPVFEPLTPPGRQRSGPLAVSSPLTSGREVRRTWTPAQDLDENSLDESAENSGKSTLPGLSTPPKFTSRTNMFTPSGIVKSDESEIHSTSPPVESSVPKTPIKDSVPQKFNSLRKLKRSKSGRRSPDFTSQHIRSPEDAGVPDDNWRDNWSMSRSIPNSLNTCDEVDCASNGRPCRSRAGSQIGLNDQNGDVNSQSRPITPSYLQYGTGGHIMYLPEYNSRKITRNSVMNDSTSSVTSKSEINKILDSSNKNHKYSLEKGGNSHPENYGPTSLPSYSDNNGVSPFSGQMKKSKKFSYQSTVRVLEKRKLEEKLAREVAEKEEQRLREAQTMKQVEEEFQRKREKEKQKLRKQNIQNAGIMSPKTNIYDVNFLPNSYTNTHSMGKLNGHSDYLDPRSNMKSNSPTSPARSPSSYSEPFQSLPHELMVSNNDSVSPNSSSRLFKGFKSWVKSGSNKESYHGSGSGGYASETSSNSLTSAPRQEPDGAPASSPRRKNNKEDFRAEIIAASRQRNGDHNLDEDYSSNHSRRSMSPETRRLTQELPELVQERREYREYRPSRHSSSHSHNQSASKSSSSRSALSGNYRKDFAFGHSHSYSSHSTSKHKGYDESDRISRHSSEEKRSEGSGRSVQRSSSSDLIETIPPSNGGHYSSSSAQILPHHNDHSLSFNYSKGYNTSAINSSPARFAHSLLTPFNNSQGYRPVSFSPPPPTKILHVK